MGNQRNCNREALIGWPSGNDVYVKVWLYEHVMEGQQEVRRAFVPDADDVLTVQVSGFNTRTLDFERDGMDLNALIVHFPYTLEISKYDLMIDIVRSGRHVRSFDCGIIDICRYNHKSKTLLTKVGENYHTTLNVELQIVFTAITQGKSAYEEWRELPGNESKTLQDFINEVINLNGITEAALETIESARTTIRDTNAAKDAAVKSARDAHAAAVAAGKVNAVLHGTTLTVTDHDGQSESVDVKGDTGFCFFALFDVDESGDLVMTHNPLDEVVLEVEDGDLYQTYNIQTA